MTRKVWTAALVAALGVAVPAASRASAGEDAKDTAAEHGHNAKKTVRSAKPGGESAADRKEDAKDTGHAMKAKSEKELRHARDATKDTVHDATK
jgi:hypothetical protein